MPLQALARPREHSQSIHGAPAGPKRKHSNINRLWSSLDVGNRLLGGPKSRGGRTKTTIKKAPG
eukprot:8331043-Alexandrium_andersonii.AAC.1